MRSAVRVLGVCIMLCFLGLGLRAQGLTTNIRIEATSASGIEKGTPCYVVIPEGEPGAVLRESGVVRQVEKALDRRGYDLVKDPKLAAVFVKVDFAQLAPVKVPVEISERPTVDYSNSVSAKNLAATTGNGRYKNTNSDPSQHNDIVGEVILGPDGQPVTLKGGDVERNEREKGFSTQTTMTMYPLDLQIAAWKMGKSDGGIAPENVWMVRAAYKNYRPEDLVPQLRDIAKVAVKYFGKGLKKPKTVRR